MTHAEMTALDVMGAAPPPTTCHCGADLHKAAEIAAGICVRCYRDRQMDGYEIMQDGTRVPSTHRIRHGYNAVPCACGQHYDLDRNGRCLACRVGTSGDKGFWRSVAIETRVDERDDAANERAEEQEERERGEEEWEYEQALLQTEGERCPPF